MTDGIERLVQVTQMKSNTANEEALKDGLDLSSAYEEASPKTPIFDPTVTEQIGLTGAEEQALQEAGFSSEELGPHIDAVLAEIAAVIQLVQATGASPEEQRDAAQERIDGLKSGLSTDTVVQPALEGLTPQQWDVIGAITKTHLQQPAPEPTEAGPSPDLAISSYEEVSRDDSIMDSEYGQIQDTDAANEEALQNANEQKQFEIQQLMDDHNKATTADAVKEQATNALLNGFPGQRSSTYSPTYEEVYHEDSVIDSVYGQVQETKSSKANEEALEGAKQQALNIEQQKSLRANEQSLEEKTDKDGLDLSSAYEEAAPNNSVFDSVYGQIQGAAPPKVAPTQYPPDLPSPSGGEELLPDGNANGIPGEYGDGPDLDANGVPDEIDINPDSLQPGYPNSPWTTTLDPALFDPTEPGPTLDPNLFDPTSSGPTLDPSLFDPHLPGLTLDPALLDPKEPGPTLDPALLDPSTPGETIDPTQLEQGIVQPSGGSEPASVTNQSFTDPGTSSVDAHEHDDLFEGV